MLVRILWTRRQCNVGNPNFPQRRRVRLSRNVISIEARDVYGWAARPRCAKTGASRKGTGSLLNLLMPSISARSAPAWAPGETGEWAMQTTHHVARPPNMLVISLNFSTKLSHNTNALLLIVCKLARMESSLAYFDEVPVSPPGEMTRLPVIAFPTTDPVGRWVQEISAPATSAAKSGRSDMPADVPRLLYGTCLSLYSKSLPYIASLLSKDSKELLIGFADDVGCFVYGARGSAIVSSGMSL